MKKVIQRNLPLNTKYFLVNVSYQSIENGGGCACDNCGKLITNVANIKNDHGKQYAIGLDCLDTLLENNNLLEHESYAHYQFSDKPAIAKAKSLRSKLLNNLKKDPTYKAVYGECTGGRFGFSFEAEIIRTFKYDETTKSIISVDPYKSKDPRGFDYTFNPEYKELTLNYIKGLTNVIY